MYTPHPLPTLEPNQNPFLSTMYSSIDLFISRVTSMLQSIPVVPNSQGLFDRNGNWLPPVISFYDVFVAFLVIGLSISFLLHLNGSVGLLGTLSSAVSRSKNEH